jgi:hypothetical protein
MARRPTGPEDPTPGPEVSLNADQALELAELLGAQSPHQKDSLLHRRKGSVRLVDRGAAYVEVRLLDPEGQVISSRLLFPRAARDSPAAVKRWLRELREREQAD